MGSIVGYLKDVRSELTKVTWPKKVEVIRLTLVIFTVSGIFGLFIGVLDFSFTKLLEFLVSR
jgi:preprotein translocase subunit SecE